MTEARDHRLGCVTLSPATPIVAGTRGTWTLRYVVGSYGIDEGGTIKVARRFASDWERPQFDDPAGPAYTTATTTGEASLALRYDPKAHVRPWMKCLVIDVYDGCLAPGDEVTITFGDTSGGGPGIRAQSFIESAHELRVLVDPTNACLVRRLPSSPIVRIVSGEPVTVVPIVPTAVVVGEAVEVFLKGEDRWGNPTPPPEGIALRWEGEGEVQLRGATLCATTPARGRVVARWADRDHASNPLTATAQPRRFGAYWADLHAQSDATVGTGTEVEYFAFGRDWAHLDVMSHQGNDFQVTDEDWRRLGDVVERFHEDGRFVVFPGFEWSANTPAGGDRNVIYRGPGHPIFRSSHWQVDGTPEDDRTPAHPADGLYAAIRRHVDPSEVLVASHCGGRYADIVRWFDAELEPLVEVASCWGVFEWLLFDAFDQGYRVGVMCNSDGHKGRPGAEGPGAGQFGIYGGLTCILAEALTRASVFDALKQRRCYGTTGARIDLSLSVDGAPMGSVLPARSRASIEAAVVGTAPIDSLALYDGRQRIAVARPSAFADLARSRCIRITWGGARIRGRGRRAVWDGTITVDGTTIEDASTFAFDSPADGITERTEASVAFRSRTTGDLDGIELRLSHADRGRVRFTSEVGTLEVDLATLTEAPHEASFGGLDLHARIERHPESLTERAVTLQHTLALPPGKGAALWVKAVQTDGHTAWSSPIYLG